jgi:hypothetical protein
MSALGDAQRAMGAVGSEPSTIEVTDTDREKAIELFREIVPTTDMISDAGVLLDALRDAGWRPGGAPVAPTREAALDIIAPVIGEFVTHAPVQMDGPNGDYWRSEAGAVYDALLASGVLGERREDVQAEALEAAAREFRTNQEIVFDHELHAADWLGARAAELRKVAQS